MGPQRSVPTLFFHKPCFFVGCSFSGSHRSYCRRNICILTWEGNAMKSSCSKRERSRSESELESLPFWAPRKLNRRWKENFQSLKFPPPQLGKGLNQVTLTWSSPYLQHMLFSKASWRMIGVHMCHHGLKSDLLLKYVGVWESYLYNRRSRNWRHLRKQFIPLSEHVD